MIGSCSSKKSFVDEFKYLNKNNREISKRKFQKKSLSFKYAGLTDDLLKQKKLILRKNKGKISNRPNLISLFEKELNIKIESSKQLILIYNQNRDLCLSGFELENQERKYWYARVEDVIRNVVSRETTPIYIFRDKENPEKDDKKTNWYNDSDEMIEKLFFKQKYPCTRVIAIQKDGTFVSYIAREKQGYLFAFLGFWKK